jgi:hypothetical protein
MPKFISGKKLMEKWDILPFEFLEYVKLGKLRPYDQFGRLRIHPYYLPDHEWQRLVGDYNQFQDQWKVLEALPIPKAALDRLSLETRKMANLAFLHNADLKHTLHKTASRKAFGWEGCQLPGNQEHAQKVIDAVLESLYHERDISKIDAEIEKTRRVQAALEKPKKVAGKKLRKNQIHRANCRNAALKLWNEHPNITIADMILRDEIARACDGKVYAEKTLRNWIKDLAPDRSAGRRPKRE